MVLSESTQLPAIMFEQHITIRYKALVSVFEIQLLLINDNVAVLNNNEYESIMMASELGRTKLMQCQYNRLAISKS